MAIKGITFAGQNVTPKNDGSLYGAHYGDGILNGCEMNISGDGEGLTIQAGHLMACGRVCQIDGDTTIDLSDRTLTNGYIQVTLDLDTSLPEGEQWNIHRPLIESATTTFPALTKDDINTAGTLYQLQLAVVQISGGNLTSIVSSLGGSGLISSGGIVSDGSLRINSDGTRRAVTFYDGDTNVGRLRYNAVTGYTEAGSIKADGTLKAGIRAASVAEVFADNDEIRFYPKGANDSTNAVTIDTDGQIHGGCTVLEATKTTSTSITAGNWTAALCSLTLPKGKWIITGSAQIRGTGANATNWATINVGASTAATVGRNTIPLCGTTATYLTANCTYIFENNGTTTINLYCNAEVATVVSNATLRAMQIG